jgi:hypothetical protein
LSEAVPNSFSESHEQILAHSPYIPGRHFPSASLIGSVRSVSCGAVRFTALPHEFGRFAHKISNHRFTFLAGQMGKKSSAPYETFFETFARLGRALCHFFVNVRSSGNARWSSGGNLSMAIIPTKIKTGNHSTMASIHRYCQPR